MSAIFDLVLGIVTSIVGFVEVGSISTSAQAGAEYGFQLLWAIAIAGAMLALLTEMSGRLSVMSKRSLAAAVRERFGIHFHVVPLAAELVLDLCCWPRNLAARASRSSSAQESAFSGRSFRSPSWCGQSSGSADLR